MVTYLYDINMIKTSKIWLIDYTVLTVRYVRIITYNSQNCVFLEIKMPISDKSENTRQICQKREQVRDAEYVSKISGRSFVYRINLSFYVPF